MLLLTPADIGKHACVDNRTSQREAEVSIVDQCRKRRPLHVLTMAAEARPPSLRNKRSRLGEAPSFVSPQSGFLDLEQVFPGRMDTVPCNHDPDARS